MKSRYFFELNDMLRRTLLASFASAASAASTSLTPFASFAAEPDAATVKLLRRGGLVLVMRHALAPGTFDPPEFNVNVCATQRNLSDEGRAQARRIGQWFTRHQLKPTTVLSSPWCRCIDTATLAFGRAQAWTALASPVGTASSTNLRSQRELALAVSAVSKQVGRFEVWVTHQFVINDLAGVATDSGEGVLLRTDANETVQLAGRIPLF